MALESSNVERALEATISKYRGPGGAIAVLKNGEVVGKRVWGYADLVERVAMTPETIMPICSISKQMVCQLLVDLRRNLISDGASEETVEKRLSDMLHEVMGRDFTTTDGLTIEDLCNNASGIRDYWAMCILWGARAESRFVRLEDGPRALERTKTLHFEPRTEFSYCNLNFHIVGRVIERLSGNTLEKLLAQKVFTPAGMKTAKLCADTAQQPGPCIGYEGNEANGYTPAVNRIEWAGDAGIVASLQDMIAYEHYVDRSSSDPQSLYHTIAQPQSYKDGTLAGYHNGLFDSKIDSLQVLGHGGALRGYRLQRLYAPKERLSVVIMLNHEADTSEAAEFVMRELTSLPQPENMDIAPSNYWFGHFLDDDTKLAVTVTAPGKGRVAIDYAGGPEIIRLIDAQYGRSRTMEAKLEGDMLRINRLGDHRILNAKRLSLGASLSSKPLVGKYQCAEVESEFTCHGDGNVLYGSFDGFMGKGPMHLMRRIGDDVWLLACPRGPDAPAPGNWTLVFQRDESKQVVGVTIGCWLARKVTFSKSK